MLTRQNKASPSLPFDPWLIGVVAALVALGLLMVASASITVSDHEMHQPFYYFYKQLVFLALGIAAGCVLIQIEIDVWEKFGGTILITAIVLLALVLIPGIGRSVNGSARWIGIGPIGIEVSELAKLAVVIYLAGYLLRRNAEIQQDFSGFLKPVFLLSIIAILLLKEPDFGATVVIITTALAMMFLAGMRLRPFIVLLLGVLALMAVLAVSAPYRLKRLTSFLDPWANAFSSGYQLTQSLIAFGRGGWFGVGLGKSIQKLFYLPEAHTDFLFAVIAEEFGLIGVTVVIALFVFLVLRIFFIGRKAQQLHRHFAGFMAYGFGIWIAIQFMVNIGVNAGVLPTKGLTLPLMSYGGSSLLVNCLVIALLLRIDYENRVIATGLPDV